MRLNLIALMVVFALAAPASAAKKRTVKKAAAPMAAAAPACAERPCGPFASHLCDCYVSSSGERCFDSMAKCNADLKGQ